MLRYHAVDLRDIAEVYAIRLASILKIPDPKLIDTLVLRDILSLACSMGVFGRGNNILLDIINVKDDRVVHPENVEDCNLNRLDDSIAEQVEELEDDISEMIETRIRACVGDIDVDLKIHRIVVKSEFTAVISYMELDEDLNILCDDLVEKEIRLANEETP